ncbi:MAG: hypothetical protein KAV97_05320 [Actinomycetia bacterium]|nr:hypothetical protein [Actinomycetes bacterium]
MENEKRLSRGLRKYIRRKKAEIRKSIDNMDEQERLIKKLMSKFISKEITKK